MPITYCFEKIPYAQLKKTSYFMGSGEGLLFSGVLTLIWDLLAATKLYDLSSTTVFNSPLPSVTID